MRTRGWYGMTRKQKVIPAPILILRGFDGANASIIWQASDELELEKILKENTMNLNDWIVYPSKIMHFRLGAECLHSGWVKDRKKSKRQKAKL